MDYDMDMMRQMIREEIKNVMSEGDYDKEMESEEYAGMEYDEKDGDMEYSDNDMEYGDDYEKKTPNPMSSTTVIEIIPVGSNKKKKKNNPNSDY